MLALDSLKGFDRIDWSFGGGTAMRLAFHHRESKDIDIFLTDATVLNGLSPRLNDLVDGLDARYTEQSNFLKLRFPDGEIDFILAPRLLRDVPFVMNLVRGRNAWVEQPIEIVAKKCFYRAADFTIRDVFDLAVLLEHEPQLASDHRSTLLAKRDLLQKRLSTFSGTPEAMGRFSARMAEIVATPKCEYVKAIALERFAAFLQDDAWPKRASSSAL